MRSRIRQLQSGNYVGEIYHWFWKWRGVSSYGNLYSIGSSEYGRFCICSSEQKARENLMAYSDRLGK